MFRPPPIRYVGRVWPNGEFGISRQKEVSISFEGQSHFESHEAQWNKNLIAAHGIEKAIAYKQEERGSCYLGLSLLTKSRTKAKRGSKGISRYGSRMVRNAAYVLERDCDRRRLSFATLTLPRMSDEQVAAVAENWSAIVKRFTERLKRHLVRLGLPGEIVSVTEVQEKRFSRTGQVAYHLHSVFQGSQRTNGGWALKWTDLRRYWSEAVSTSVPNECDWSACENIQRVKKSAAGYLGKYMSKGVRTMATIVSAIPIPSAWWSCTQSLRARVKKETITSDPGIQCLAQMCQAGLIGTFKFLRQVLINISEDFSYPVGWFGVLEEDVLIHIANSGHSASDTNASPLIFLQLLN